MTTPPRTLTEARDALVCVYPGCPVANIPQHLYHTPTTGNVRFGSEWNRVHHPFLTASTLWTLARSDFAARVEALASQWEREAEGGVWAEQQAWRIRRQHAAAIRALLSEPTPEAASAHPRPHVEVGGVGGICAHCGEAWPCWQVRVDPVDSHHHPAEPTPAPVERCGYYEPYNTDPCGRPKESAVHDAVYGSRAHHPFTPEARDE